MAQPKKERETVEGVNEDINKPVTSPMPTGTEPSGNGSN